MPEDTTQCIQARRAHALRRLVPIAVLALVAAVSGARAQHVEEKPDLGALFAEAGTTGTIVVHAYGRDTTVVSDEARARTPYSPSSTFKIPNTLLALRLGAASGMDEVFAPPAQPYLVRGKPILPPACDAPITLAAALVNSCIPVYQTIAGRIGVASYNEFLVRMNYGPAVVTDDTLDDFWLTGALKITAADQVGFLDRMLAGRLPFQTDHIEAMAQPLLQEESEKGRLYAKTGYVFTTTPELGWFVGWIRKDGAVTATFALNLDITKPEHARARKEIALKALKQLGLW
ncbi:class D beta-lactamase [Enterovirga rhinocerotis]|uniref:Beta-lactamase n=1 Tax=Enterovirga rhinocerotis TaxID=1339210 RepID=A0A4R7C6H7_9HYPH|nr:class D beta-lactamase [Enterovirga rhinocerotis]TDR93851.1 beta-lactamase class D [Enterovirga rhinocerotis]